MNHLKLMFLVALARTFMFAEEFTADRPSSYTTTEPAPLEEDRARLIGDIRWMLVEMAYGIRSCAISGDFEEAFKMIIVEPRRRWRRQREHLATVRATRLKRIIKRQWYLSDKGTLITSTPWWRWDNQRGAEAHEVDLEKISTPRLKHLQNILNDRLGS